MTPLFKKLNFKQQNEIFVLNHPPEFDSELSAMRKSTTIRTNIWVASRMDFVLAFVVSKRDIEAIASSMDQAVKGDGIVWYAYPKRSSKKYLSDISRESGWDRLGKSGFEAVRQVAIDDNWTALRFRRVEFIKTMNRKPDFAMTEQGKRKTLHDDR